jgi:dienelactone hydrolase
MVHSHSIIRPGRAPKPKVGRQSYYPGAGLGFHADYRPSYNATVAADAWKRGNDFLNKNLKA